MGQGIYHAVKVMVRNECITLDPKNAWVLRILKCVGETPEKCDFTMATSKQSETQELEEQVRKIKAGQRRRDALNARLVCVLRRIADLRLTTYEESLRAAMTAQQEAEIAAANV